MGTIAILRDGSPVNLPTDQFPISGFEYDINGFLMAFNLVNTIGVNKIRYYFIADFNISLRNKYKAGYYFEKDFLNVNGSPFNIDLSNMNPSTFNYLKFIANPGDTITVNKVVYEAPYTAYFKRKQFQFTIEKGVYGGKVRNYNNKAYNEVLIPSTAQSLGTINSNSNSPQKYFYDKNLGSIITTWSSEVDKKKFAALTTHIALRQRAIVNELFPKLTNNLTNIDKVAKGQFNYSNLSELDKLIFNLKRSWGYYYNNGSTSTYNSFDAILPDTPVLDGYIGYLTGLNSFYKEVYPSLKYYQNLSDGQKYERLLKILTVSALTVIPYQDKIKQINFFIKKPKVSETDEQFVVKMINSVSLADADDFLDYMLTKTDIKQINYLSLYSKITDDREARYLPFGDYKANRKNFIKRLYDLWLVSKYNMYFSPNNPNALFNTESYFFTNQGNKELKEKCTLEFPVTTKSNYEYSLTEKRTYESKILNKEISISYFTESSYLSNNSASGFGGGGLSSVPVNVKSNPKLLGSFHLYHPIFIYGYQADLEIQLPQQPFVPAFMFHYYQDFEAIKEWDAKINLGINIAFEATMFFISGGTTTLLNLRHLKYLTQIGRALRNTLAPAELVTFWAAANSSTQAINLTASTVYALSQYTSQITNDLERKNMAEKLSNWMLITMFVTAIPAFAAETKVVNSAKAFLDEVELLTNAGKPLVPAGTSAARIAALNEVIAAATSITLDKLHIIDKVVSKLNALGADGSSVKTLFNSTAFTP